ncbi:MAG: TVP38/TMEM64 family protein [Eggerthellaceae bacterium]|nr:TVP38/TMEM64 family protein [Eggerthellaceae bacterium]
MKNAKVWVFIALIVAVVVANHFFGWSDWIASGKLQSMLSSMISENYALACVVYVVVSIVGSVVLALPGILFALAAGAIFGPIMGTFLCWLSMTIGACGAFLAGRYFLKDALKPKLEKNKTLNKFLFEGADKSDVFLLAVTRLVPVFPFNLQNFAYGVTDIRFAPYALYSALFILPGTAAYTIGAAGIVDAENRVTLILVAVALFAASFGVAWYLKRKADIS